MFEKKNDNTEEKKTDIFAHQIRSTFKITQF
jgi:hypothetical protein